MTGPQKASSLWLAQENQHLHMKIDALNAELLAAKALLQDNAAACTRLVDERDILRAENARLRAALEWYADEHHYLRGIPGNPYTEETDQPAGAYYANGGGWRCDEGWRARAALSDAPGQ